MASSDRAGLGVGEAGVVVDHSVDVVEPDAAGRARTWAAVVDPPASTVGDPVKLLHIDVDQLTGRGAFVAVG